MKMVKEYQVNCLGKEWTEANKKQQSVVPSSLMKGIPLFPTNRCASAKCPPPLHSWGPNSLSLL